MFGIKSKIENYWTYKNLSEEDIFHSDKANAEFKDLIVKNSDILAQVFEEYTSDVSSASMAASPEILSILYSICEILKPKKVLDMGSGISSYVFRLYQKKSSNDCIVYSIDDDEAWLKKTEAFLENHSLNTENLMTLEDFKQISHPVFDLIFHDLNFVEERIKHIDFLVDIISPEGAIIFDDVHKINYFKNLTKILRRRNLHIKSLKKESLDNFRRFAILASNNERL